MADLDTLTQRLASATERLRTNSDRLNRTIELLQDRLRAIDPGIPFALEDPDDLLGQDFQIYSLADVEVDQTKARRGVVFGDGCFFVRKGYRLGWRRVARTWRLTVDEAEAIWNAEAGPLTDLNRESLVALADAPRHVRLEAISKLPKLVEKITEQVERYAYQLEQRLEPVDGWIANLEYEPRVGHAKAADNEIPF